MDRLNLWFRERVRAIRPEYLPADPVDRLEHPPGRALQCDLWFPAPKIAVGLLTVVEGADVAVMAGVDGSDETKTLSA